MTPYFLDTSALVKRYVTAETGAVWVRDLFDPLLGNVIFIANVSSVELIAALSKKLRMGEISATDRGALMAAFRASAADYFFVHVDPLVPAAEAVAERHGLRAYDAVQLAAAMEARGRLSPALAASFVMVAADTQLLAAAAAEGLATEDPNQH